MLPVRSRRLWYGVDVGLVAQPQLDRVDPEIMRQRVHRRLEPRTSRTLRAARDRLDAKSRC